MAIEPPWAQVSPIRAAGLPPIITLLEPLTIASGGPTHIQLSPIQAAGIPPINTVGAPGPMIGPPTWGIGAGTAGVCIGQVCRSPILAAAGMAKQRRGTDGEMARSISSLAMALNGLASGPYRVTASQGERPQQEQQPAVDTNQLYARTTTGLLTTTKSHSLHKYTIIPKGPR
jgi:hypothetical protein